MNQDTHPPEAHPQSDFSELRDRVGRIETGLEDNTAATQRIEEKLGQVFELMQFGHSAYGFFATIGRGLRRFVVWISPFLALAGMVWALMHGRWPDKP